MRLVSSTAIGLSALFALRAVALAQDTTVVADTVVGSAVDTVTVLKVDTVVVVDTIVCPNCAQPRTVPQDSSPLSREGDIYSWNFESAGPPRGDRFGWFTNRRLEAANHPPKSEIVEDGRAAEGTAYARTVTDQYVSYLVLVLGDVGPVELEELFVSFLIRRSPASGGKVFRFYDRNMRTLGYLDVRNDSRNKPGSLHWVFDTGVPNSFHSRGGVVPSDRWVRLEIHYDRNPGGHGVVRIWADGIEVLQATDPGTSDRLIGIVVAPQSQGPPRPGKLLDYDDFVFSTQRIGR